MIPFDAAPLMRPGTGWERADATRDGWADRLHELHASLREALSWTIRMRPFLAEVLVKTRYVFTHGVLARAHRADGVVLLSPDFWASIDAAGRTWVLAEAAMTYASDQLRRGDGRHALAWSAACLHTNARLLERARMRAPESIRTLVRDITLLFEPTGTERSDAALYGEIRAALDDGGMSDIDASLLPLQLPSTETLRAAERDGTGLMVRPGAMWLAAMMRGLGNGKAHGLLPSDLLRAAADEAYDQRVDWRSVLWRRLRQDPSDARTFAKINRRRLHLRRAAHGRGHVLPPGRRRDIAPVALAIDTSGSMGEDDLGVLRRELQAVADLARRPLRVLVCDAEVHVDTESRDMWAVDLVGGGGTSAIPVFETLADDPPVALVYATDLCMDFPDEVPAYPVYWLVRCAGYPEPPFGEVIVRGDDE